jgi:glutathione S-transferase
MITLYGSAMSTAWRCMWMLEEIGQEYQSIPISIKEGQNKTPEVLALNPNGKVPTLVVGDFVLWESAAINQYLAEKYKPELLGTTVEERALNAQWCYWASIYPSSAVDGIYTQGRSAEPDMAVLAKETERFNTYAAILDAHLKDRNYIAGEAFGIADIQVASIFSFATMLRVSLDAFPHIGAWMQRVLARPACQKVMAEMKG